MVSTMTSVEKVKIPEGYKQTEVGVIPEDWNTKNIGSYLSIRHGRDQKQVQCEDGAYPILGTGGEMGRTNIYIYDKPSVLIGRKGSINKPRFMETPFWTVDTLFYSEVDSKYSPKYLFYKFCMIDWMGHNEASGVPSLNASTIEGVLISCPDNKQEQTAIANALSDVDNLIASLETLIAKKSAIKTAAMQQLLTGKKRLPGFESKGVKESEKQGTKASENKAVTESEQEREQESENQGSDQLAGSGSTNQAAQPKTSKISASLTKSAGQTAPRPGYKQTELGEIPEDWEAGLLGNYLENCTSGATPYRGTPEFYKGNVRWITSGELNYNVITDTIEKISEDAVKRTNLRVHPVGTFLMAITGLEAAGTRGSCGIVGAPATTNQSCMALYTNDKLSTEYLFHYYIYMGDELAFKYCQGSKQQSYTAKIVKLLPFSVPKSVEEQTAIANVLSDMDTELDALQQRLNKTQKIKQGMMQELLTGKTRLV